MKKLRLLILTALIVAALFAAIIPAFASVTATWSIYNLSFMGDKNGDNIPDKWNVKGDVVRNCDHPYYPPALDLCAMIFLPSNSGAAVWQRLNMDASWTVVEEGQTEIFGRGGFAAKQMDMYRAYYGTRLIYTDQSKIVVYAFISGGTYNFDTGSMQFYGDFSQDIEQDIADGLVMYYDHGVLVLPHDGYLAVDWLRPYILDFS